MSVAEESSASGEQVSASTQETSASTEEDHGFGAAAGRHGQPARGARHPLQADRLRAEGNASCCLAAIAAGQEAGPLRRSAWP